MSDYSKINTWSQYRPWVDNEEFNMIWDKVKSRHTLLDIHRGWELYSLAKDMAERGGDVLEVGCWRGGSGMCLAQGTTNGEVFLCDTFKGVVKAGRHDNVYRNGEHDDATFWGVIDLAKELGLGVTVLDGIFPEETGHKIEDKKFKLVHIDVDVYWGARDVTLWVWPRLLIGGVIVYDDYGFKQTQGVREYVDELRQYDDRVVTYNLNGQAIVVKVK